MLAEVRGAGRPGVSRWRRGLCLSKQFAKRRSLKNARVPPPPLTCLFVSSAKAGRPFFVPTGARSSCGYVGGVGVGNEAGGTWA
jgi:hypothetical protein